MITKNQEDPLPVDPKRVKAFAVFFKRYMSISTLVVASLPIPVTALGLIPTFAVHTKLLSIYTPLFCFLVLGFIFYSRHKLARIMFPEHLTEVGFILPRWARGARALIRALPLLLIISCVLSVLLYHALFDYAAYDLRRWVDTQESQSEPTKPVIQSEPTEPVIQSEPTKPVPRPRLHPTLSTLTSSLLIIFYLSIFLTAEAAFILMAVKEYLQDLVGLTEMDLIRGPKLAITDIKATQE